MKQELSLSFTVQDGNQRKLFIFPIGCTQLRHLCKDYVPTLLRNSLPSGWLSGDMVQWFPEDETRNHPPRSWLRCVWDYLREHFETADDLSTLENLPLIPLDLSQVPINLTRLTRPSKIVVRLVNNDHLDSTVREVLKVLGVIVMQECPKFLRSHPGVLETFVHPPSVRGVLQAMAASSSIMGEGMLSAVLLDKVTSDGKQALRNFIAKESSLDSKQKELLHCLPLFETVKKDFVSNKEGLCAAPVDFLLGKQGTCASPEDAFPVTPQRDFIDIKEDGSKRLVHLLDIRTLTPTEFLLEEIFPDIIAERYSGEEVDRIMDFVMEKYQVYVRADTTFEDAMKCLPFVSTKSGKVKAMDLFDPRRDPLKRMFAEEDVFPVGEHYTVDPAVLVVLEKLGMKSEENITAQDLYQSAKKIPEISCISTAVQKSEALMMYLDKKPMKLQETISGTTLGSLLQDISWISELRQKPHGFPRSLHFWRETEKEAHFYKPTEVKSEANVNLIGTVKPVVKADFSSQLAPFFGWDMLTDVMDVVEHFKMVISCYTEDEKPHYIAIVKDVYHFLSRAADDVGVMEALQGIENSSWIWSGDGFSSPNTVLAEKPCIDLSPYICSLPSEVQQFSNFFAKFGMRKQCDVFFLLQVLHMIKQKYERGSGFPKSEVTKDLQLSVNILNEVKPNVGEQLPSELQEKVLIPTHVEGDSYVKLAPVENCMYCEHEWLEGGSHDEEMDFLYVHPNIPNSTAELLRVPTLMNRMLEPDEMQIGDEFGQEEKLTDRLHRLLEDYTDGFAILKELVQNADDAGATEVRFLYDERANEDAMTCLIDEGMKECQGPALWVYNDAEFRDEDFVNITKLNGSTKEQETEKIGKFGLGFNAVYNLTDVPMFVSRNYFAIFDPNTFYLGKAIRNKNKPGMKIDLNKNTKRLRKFKNQFKPFNGIFGCDLHLDKEDNSFNGTLFRFPLRTREQAAKSEIKELYYSDQEMRELLEIFLERAKLLLLFTQNVIQVGIYSLPRSLSQIPRPQLMFQVTKSISECGILRELSVPVTLPDTAKKLNSGQKRFLKQCNFLQVSSKIKRDAKSHKVAPSKFPESSISVDIKCVMTNSGLNFFKMDEISSQECTTWLVVSSMGKGQAVQFAESDPSLLPSAGIAVQLIPTESKAYLPSPVVNNVDGSDLNGAIFCYLPLPIHSGLPVHINGAFAVTSNRRHLQEKLEDDKTGLGVKWNSVLMEDSISVAYVGLLEDVKLIVPDDDSYVFHSLWPKASEVKQGCEPILTSFYRQLASGAHALFCDGFEWVAITRVVFLHPDLRVDPEIGDVSFTVLQHLAKVSDVVVDLPAEVFQSFLRCGLWDVIASKTYDESRFYCELFFPNISIVRSDLRDVLVLHALDRNNKDFDESLKKNACIPTSQSGKIVKLPSQLVNPQKEASSLFSHADGRFPCGKDSFLKSARLDRLEQLGMMSDDLPWEDIAERTESIQRLNAADSKAAVKRVKALVKFVEKKIKRRDEGPSQPVLTRLLDTRFLPVMQKPKSFPLSWKGDEFKSGRRLLLAPKNVFLEENKYLVCCTEPLVDLEIPKKVKALLKLEEREVTAEHVMKQLEDAISTNTDTLDRKGYEEVRHVCTEAYSFLQDKMASCSSSLKEFLLDKRFILIGRRFLSANHVAFEIKTDCSPYLYKLPQDLSDAFLQMMQFAGVRKQFEAKDYISGLKEVKKEFDEMQLDEQTLEVAVNMAIQLGETLEGSGGDPSEDDKWSSVYLPDSRGVVRTVRELCFKDCPWMPDDPEEHFVHGRIPWSLCDKLGVKTRRDEALLHHDAGFPFGQKEKLTNRLKRILTGYPGEKEILKELLQNADDAQATEICFVKDPRHHPDKTVFKDSWKPLQGPALCVYNNRPFTNEDIEGICNLGEGSKGEDPNKTGQYGVGFNAVYHLTDVPSFMSKGDDIGDVLCVFDPHCKHVPHASVAKPGRMFKNIEALKRKFPDVFSCYLEEHFPINNATMFRFPLKSAKMAEESQISRTPVTVENLDSMMEDLKKELFEVLLFVNNVKKISICAIDERGDLVKTYSVEVVNSQEDDRDRQAFAHYMKVIGKQAKETNFLPTSIGVKRCIYTLTLRDSIGVEEKWLIVQQVGFEKPVEKSIVKAFKQNQLGMLPRGGVACLLDSTLRSQMQRKRKAFCFLPLPFETNLPVHVNGHFALDHEARRNLWRDEAGGCRSDWNNALLGDVIASCYLTLLDEVRGFIHLPVMQDVASGNSTFSRNTTLMRLKSYENLFPKHAIDDTHWKRLVDSVYQEMSKKEMRLIPLVRSLKASSRGRAKDSQGSERVQVTWFPPTGTGKEQIYFNNLETKGCFAALPQRHNESKECRQRAEDYRTKQKNTFEKTLLETGFNLVASSMAVFDSFREAGVEVCCVSPSAVINFYKSFSDVVPLCNIGAIPCLVKKTPFKGQEGVIRVLKYCKDDEGFMENLSGLPLLLTEDSLLSAFNEGDPRCLSRYQDILPHSPSLFVHARVRSEVFNGADCRRSSVFRPLDVELFASHLPHNLPPHFRSEDQYVQWSPDKSAPTLPNHRWINRVWDFLREFVDDTMKKSDLSETSETAFIRDLLSPLQKWSILPATETNQKERTQVPCSLTTTCDKQTALDHSLVPLDKAESVLDFIDCGEASQRMVDILRNLGLPELNAVVLTTMGVGPVPYNKLDSYELARNLVATLKRPHSLLMALKQKLQRNPSSLDRKLKFSEAIVILDYFSRNIESVTEADKETFRKLPFYPTASGGLTKLDDRKVFLLPEIPKNEMDVVESRVNCFFLESRRNLSELYEFLEVERVSSVEMYLKFVLKCFQHLSREGKLAHLHSLRQLISSTGNEDEQTEKNRLLDHLRSVEFIPTTDGTLKKASSFYDPHNDVFCSMLPEDKFPPDPFASDEWLPFLKKIGLVVEVSQDTFVDFANQVAREASTARTENTYRRSEVLVRHLISRPNVVDEVLLYRVRNIPFVAAVPVKESLKALCPPFAEQKEDKIPFIAYKGAVVNDYEEVVWTKAHLLPKSADPRCHRYELGCTHRNIDKYLSSLLSQLEVFKKPSVDLVVSHCQTICFHLEGKKEKEDVSCEQRSTIMGVMESIYTFLQENAVKDHEAKRLLQTTRCILVEEGRKFILPSQAVLELYETHEIRPFLYRVPPEFGKFRSLFEFLGCSKNVRPAHYAMVLEMLHKNCQNTKLHPNEVHTCSKAVEGFFDKLQEDGEDLSTLSKLYLPAMPPGLGSPNTPLSSIPVTLHQSTDLVFDDAPTYYNRIQELSQPFVLELSLMGVSCKSAMMNYKDLMMKLPSALQPKMLSSVVNEKLSDPENAVTVTSEAVNALKQQLSSVQFCRGIARIIRHANSQRKDFDEGIIGNIERSLRSIELCAVESLQTSLFYNAVLIPGSEAKVPYFQEKLEVSGADMWRVYICSVAGMDDTISTTSLVTNVIVEMYGESLGMKAFVISEMLRCSPAKIWSLLDRMGIRKDDSYSAADMEIYPEPGSLIPIEDHHLLNDAFEEFEPEEYVGYQLHDPSLVLNEGIATYIYAIIVKEVTNEDAGVLTKTYKINIGHGKESKVASAADLHKFHRLKEIFDQQRNCQRNRQEVFDEITAMLMDAWELPEDERRQIVKRLCLQWHPEKNLGDEEVYRAVLQHIQNEVSRLGGSYDDLFASWGARAREHGSQRQDYRKRFSQKYGTWGSSSGHKSWVNFPPSFCKRNRQPGEARRWFRQAEADLEAGGNEIAFSRPAYEWACFKCHQVKSQDLFPRCNRCRFGLNM